MKKEIKPINCPHIEFNVASIKEVAEAVGAVYSDGAWWKQIKKGFWWLLDFITFVEDNRKPPKMRYWGFQYLNKSNKTNSILRYMFIADLQKYTLQNIESKARTKTRQSMQCLEIKKISKFNEHEGIQASKCWNELVGRTGWRRTFNKNDFQMYWKNLLFLPGHTVIGAYYEGKLIGWIVGISFDNGNCYMTRYASLNEYFKFRVNNCLNFTFLMSAKNSGLKTANAGIFIPQKPSLDNFKEDMGLKLTSFPAYTFINPILRPVITNIFRKEIDRFTGWYSITNSR